MRRKETELTEEEEKALKIYEMVCPVCQKAFILPPKNVYKHRKTGAPVCSWTCVCRSEGPKIVYAVPELCRKCRFLSESGACVVNRAREYRTVYCKYYIER